MPILIPAEYLALVPQHPYAALAGCLIAGMVIVLHGLRSRV